MELTKQFLLDHIETCLDMNEQEEWDGEGTEAEFIAFNEGYEVALSDLRINLNNWFKEETNERV